MIRAQVVKVSRSAAINHCIRSSLLPLSSSLASARGFHSTGARTLDILGFLKGRKEQPGLAPVKKAEATSKVIKDIEEREARNEKSKNLEPVELEVIGMPPEDLSWEEQRNGFEVKGFPIRAVNPNVTGPQVDAALYRAYAEVVLGQKLDAAAGEGNSIPAEWVQAEITDLTVRLEVLKHVMLSLNTAIPDSKLVELSTLGALQTYFSTKVIGRQFNDKEPDAIYLNPADFEGTNITVLDAPVSKKAARAKWQKLVDDARKVEDEKMGKSLDAAMS